MSPLDGSGIAGDRMGCAPAVHIVTARSTARRRAGHQGIVPAHRVVELFGSIVRSSRGFPRSKSRDGGWWHLVALALNW